MSKKSKHKKQESAQSVAPREEEPRASEGAAVESEPTVTAPGFEPVPPTPLIPRIGIQEAAARFIADPRYRDTWNPAIVKHALTLGYGARCTAAEWSQVFLSYGLKVR